MQFHEKRRQQFLGEKYYRESLVRVRESFTHFSDHPVGVGSSKKESDMLARKVAADALFDLLTLRYTAGEPIEPLRAELGEVIAAYERYGEYLWQYTGDRNEPVFVFGSLDDYSQLMQLIGLCFLLHRRDLLPRLAALQDGENGSNGGADTIYEEFMIHAVGAEKRYQTEHACQVRPYENLFYALTEETPAAQLKELNLFLKHWYKDLAGTGWHDSHKPDEAGNQGGYYGYWSFEAGAAVLLLGIEDDSSLHKYLYYPKDLVAWAKANQPPVGSGEYDNLRLRCEANHPCPKEGWWFTPAKADSRRHFKQGETMPDLGTAWGSTIWQWDDQQAP